jgi:sulfate transport system ATP-binding protein
LLLDEPFGALDAKVRKDLRRWLREIHRKTGQTTIFVTHDQDEALELAERVAILNKGRIEQVGSPDDIYDRPATPFVASFVGEAIALDLLIRDGRAALGTQSFKLRQHSRQDGPARLFVRPKDVRIVEPGEGDLAAIATSVRRTASGRRVEIQLAGVADLVEIELEDGKTLRPGEPIEIILDQSLLFFQSK